MAKASTSTTMRRRPSSNLLDASTELYYENLVAYNEPMARFGPSACPSADPPVCPACLYPRPARLVSHTAARAVYSGPQLDACRLCLPRPNVRSRPWCDIATILLLYIDRLYGYSSHTSTTGIQQQQQQHYR